MGTDVRSFRSLGRFLLDKTANLTTAMRCIYTWDIWWLIRRHQKWSNSAVNGPLRNSRTLQSLNRTASLPGMVRECWYASDFAHAVGSWPRSLRFRCRRSMMRIPLSLTWPVCVVRSRLERSKVCDASRAARASGVTRVTFPDSHSNKWYRKMTPTQ